MSSNKSDRMFDIERNGSDVILRRCKDNYVESIRIPDNITIIGDSAFYGCSFLQQVEIPKNIRMIGKYAFYSCQLKNILYNGTQNQWHQVKKGEHWINRAQPNRIVTYKTQEEVDKERSNAAFATPFNGSTDSGWKLFLSEFHATQGEQIIDRLDIDLVKKINASQYYKYTLQNINSASDELKLEVEDFNYALANKIKKLKKETETHLLLMKERVNKVTEKSSTKSSKGDLAKIDIRNKFPVMFIGFGIGGMVITLIVLLITIGFLNIISNLFASVIGMLFSGALFGLLMSGLTILFLLKPINRKRERLATSSSQKQALSLGIDESKEQIEICDKCLTLIESNEILW